MGERVEQVQKMIKSFENAQKRIIRKYNEADIKKEIDDIDSILAQINSDLKRKNLHIERLEEQLKEVSPNERELIEEYKNAIEKSKSEYEEEKQSSGMQKYLDKKEELSIKLKSDKTANEKLIKQEVRNAEDKLRAKLTQEGIKLDNEIHNTELNMKLTLAQMKDFKYQYKEEDGVKIATNGDEFRKINEKYEALKVDLTELKDAKKLCETKLQEFKDRDAKEAEKFSKAWSESKKEEELKSKTVTEQKTKIEPKTEPKTESATETVIEPKTEETTTEPAAEPKTEETIEPTTSTETMQFPPYIDQSKLVSININENKGIVYVKRENGQITKYTFDEILKEKRKLYKQQYIKETCEDIARGGFKKMLLTAKVNPAIVKVLENDFPMLEEYIKCLHEKKELPFELIHDLRDSKLGIFEKMRMWVRARAEDKIPGTKVIFAKNRWNKNNALSEETKTSESSAIIDDQQQENEPKRDMKSEVKVENKDNKIEEEANKIVQEMEAKMAENVKKMLEASKGTEKDGK